MVSIESNGANMVAAIYGDIDHHSARAIREEIDAQVERKIPRLLILDFKQVSFMDSSGIGLVMGRYKLIASMGGELKIVNTSESVSRMMRLAGLSRLAEIGE